VSGPVVALGQCEPIGDAQGISGYYTAMDAAFFGALLKCFLEAISRTVPRSIITPRGLFSPNYLTAEGPTYMNEPWQSQGPSEQEIAIYAYLIWKDEGCPEKLDKVHWDQAEVQLTVCQAHDHWMKT